jgi:hypothetical protein
VAAANYIVLWKAGELRCFLLMADAYPSRYAVHIDGAGQRIHREPAKDPDDAALIAERLWKMFVDPTSPSPCPLRSEPVSFTQQRRLKPATK